MKETQESKEMLKMFETVLPNLLLMEDPVEALLMVNQINQIKLKK